MEALGFFI